MGPFTKVPVPPELNPKGTVDAMWTDTLHVVLSSSFDADGARWIHLAIRRKDGAKISDHWRTLQRIKDLLLGTEQEAVELYPARSRRVDDGNDYHLWCPAGISFHFGLRPERHDDERSKD